ncbi:DUF695 domain-containing protein [Paenibacillus ginsengarvi]|uniref:DUF695 domain-containing protein n=1 Tax=Paenibacillus ginsengarvi TaxID=400777 RepID=A0A3B0CH49_9BACL|nr:DUF695 domain-containing protein [Paenibacillus ginsengarvi]RKN84793.1 DUF695 domain-containing protein [Paenibacillus ginsengarvi]
MGKMWDYFHRTTDQKEHMSVLVDAAHADAAPKSGFTSLLSVVINLYAIAADKKERESAQAKLGVLEQRLEQTLAGHRQAVYVGRINTETRLEFYYYANPGDAPLQKLVEQAMTALPKYRWVATEREDADWSFYHFLRPNEIEKLYARNHILLRSLMEKGDRLGTARHVYHWLRFCSREEMRQAADNAKKLGYSVVNSDIDTGKPTYQHTLIISKMHPLAIGAVNDSVRELYELARAFAGKYEGWGTDMRKKLLSRLKDKVLGNRLVLAGVVLLAAALIVIPLFATH